MNCNKNVGCSYPKAVLGGANIFWERLQKSGYDECMAVAKPTASTAKWVFPGNFGRRPFRSAWIVPSKTLEWKGSLCYTIVLYTTSSGKDQTNGCIARERYQQKGWFYRASYSVTSMWKNFVSRTALNPTYRICTASPKKAVFFICWHYMYRLLSRSVNFWKLEYPHRYSKPFCRHFVSCFFVSEIFVQIFTLDGQKVTYSSRNGTLLKNDRIVKFFPAEIWICGSASILAFGNSCVSSGTHNRWYFGNLWPWLKSWSWSLVRVHYRQRSHVTFEVIHACTWKRLVHSISVRFDPLITVWF